MQPKFSRLEKELTETPPADYATTMDKLKAPDSWDVPGIIADVTARLSESGDGEAMAVIDYLVFRIKNHDTKLGAT